MAVSSNLQLSKYFHMPQRYVLGLMGFFAMVNTYTLRNSLSVTITEMTMAINTTYNLEESCQININESATMNNASRTNERILYNWSDEEQGIILSSFYYGYILTHIPGALLAETYGSKHILGFGLLSTSLCTILTPLLLNITQGNWITMVALRIISGAACGPIFPCITYILGQWIPSKERGRIGSLMFSGVPIATLMSNLVSGILINRTDDWGSVFYLFGTLGIIWYLLWIPLCYSYPEEHPFISENELDYLTKELNCNRNKSKGKTPWKAILTSLPVWGLIASQVGIDFSNYTMATDLPKYMKEILKFNVEENGIYTALPYILMWIVALLSGNISDWLIRHSYLKLVYVRTIFTTISAVGGPIFMLAASYSGCDRPLVITMFVLCMGCMGTFYNGMKVNAIDLSPNYSGTIMALMNGLGAISGIIGPSVIGLLTKDHNIKQWRYCFWITFGISIVTNLFYVIVASAEQRKWNCCQEDESDEDNVKENTTPNTNIRITSKN